MVRLTRGKSDTVPASRENLRASTHTVLPQNSQIAWSRHNLIAHASPSNARPHIVLRSSAQLAASARPSTHQQKPCLLYPPADPVTANQLFSAASATAAAASHSPLPTTEYAGPEAITFSHCGFFLAAYFPLKHAHLPSRGTSPGISAQQQQVLHQIEQNSNAAALPATSLPLASRTLSTASAPNDPALSGAANTPLPLPLSSAATTPPKLSTPTGKLCIWSRAQTGSLNDWVLIQAVPVHQDRKDETTRKANKDAPVKVNDQGQTMEASDMSNDQTVRSELCGGVRKIVWLSAKRKWVARADNEQSGFEREASRGPCFLDSEEVAGPQPDQAFVVFGHQSQISLLYCKNADNYPAANRASSSTAADPGLNLPFSILQSSLTTMALRPAPPTFEPEASTSTSPSAAQTSPFDWQESGANISHLAVGMAVGESILLVATKASATADTSLSLTEVTINLRAENVTMVTRPLDRVPLISTWTSSEGQVQENEAGLDGSARLTSLDFVHLHNKPSAETETLHSLRLIATLAQPVNCLNLQKVVPSSFVKVWDVIKAPEELSEAFQTLECRKTDQATTTRIEWQPRHALTRRLEQTTVLTVQASNLPLPISNALILSTLTATRPREDDVLRWTETIQCLDAHSLGSLGDKTLVPPQTACRASVPAVSPNGVLAAVLARESASSSRMRLAVWKMPLLGITKAGIDEAYAAKLAGLCMLRRSDPVDVSRAIFTQERGADFLVGAIQRAAELLGMTSVPGQGHSDVKTEGADGSSGARSRVSMVQALRLIELQLALVRNGTGGTERVALELALCHQLLGQARDRTMYRLDAVWSLLAQLQWVLGLLDGMGKVAVLGSEKDDALVRLFTFRTPRMLLVTVLRGLDEFRTWLLSTTERENRPAPQSSASAGVVAVSDQLELARDSLRHILSGSAVDLSRAARVLADTAAGADDASWWTSSLTSGRGEEQKMLLAALEKEALVDCVPLFLHPRDLLDEKSVLSAPASKEASERDIVRKTLIAPGGRRRKVCLRCEATSVGDEERFRSRCLCGGSWWLV